MDSGKSSPSSLVRSQSLRLSNFNRTSLVRRNQSVSAKQIKFFRNGDRYFSGLKLAVSTDRYKELNSLLAELSMKLNLSTGAVRHIFNSEDGSMITDIAQLQYGISYVCSSTNSIRQIEGGYGRLVPSWSGMNKTKNAYRPMQVLGSIENHHSLRPECHLKDFIKPKLITVIRNGKPPQKKVTLLLNSKTAISLDQVLDQLSAKGSLGKVDKLHTTFGKPIRMLRDLFEDSTVFIALSTNEKFPDDGIELDPNSYRITPYRELKKSNHQLAAVRRSNSLRHNMRFKDENENMSLSNITKNLRNGTPKVTSARQVGVHSRNAIRKIEDQKNKEELYPTSVFESDSESGKARKRKKNKLPNKPKPPPFNPSKSYNPLDIYSTVWLSDFESVRSVGSKSLCTSPTESTSASAFTESINMSHSTPRRTMHNHHRQQGQQIIDRSFVNPKRSILRTLSLPELQLAFLSGNDLSERFTQLQLEQDNRELQTMVETFQKTLDQVRTSVFPYESECCNECVDSRNALDSIFYELSHRLHTKHADWSVPPSSFERSESGYSTLNNDALIHHDTDVDLLSTDSLDSLLPPRVRESGRANESLEEKHLTSRLIKHKHKHNADDSSCCITQ